MIMMNKQAYVSFQFANNPLAFSDDYPKCGIVGALQHGDAWHAAVLQWPGLGRWVFCKYCDLNVRPLLLVEWSENGVSGAMVLCSACRYGLELLEEPPALPAAWARGFECICATRP